MVIRIMYGIFSHDGLRFNFHLDYSVKFSVEHLFYSLFFLFVPHIILSVFISLSSFILVFHHDIKPFILISLSNKCFELRTTVRQVRDILLYKFCKFIANKLVTLYSLNFCNFL